MVAVQQQRASSSHYTALGRDVAGHDAGNRSSACAHARRHAGGLAGRTHTSLCWIRRISACGSNLRSARGNCRTLAPAGGSSRM